MNRLGAQGAGDWRDGPPPIVTPEIAAEAAVWVARLHGPDRSGQMERECLRWQASSAAHRKAFESCTDTWEDVARVTLVEAYASAGAQKPESKGAGPGLRKGASPWPLAT